MASAIELGSLVNKKSSLSSNIFSTSTLSYESLENNDQNVSAEVHSKGSQSYIRKLKSCLAAVILLSSFLFIISWNFRKSDIRIESVLARVLPFKPVQHSEQPTQLWGSISKPYPTGSFWTNLAVRSGDLPISLLPYGIKTLETGIQISYGPTRRIVSQFAMSDPFVADLQVSAVQAYIGRSIESYDNVSVTMAYKTVGNGKFRTFLVKGSPFVTVEYDSTTPIISSSLMKILTVEARVVKDSVGVQYIVTLGNFQKWLVHCSEPVAFVWNGDTLTASSAIKGVVRVAVLPLQNAESAFGTLLSYVQRYPVGGTVSIAHPTGTMAQVIIQYRCSGSGPLLMLALPHHVQLMSPPIDSTDENKLVQASYTPIYSIKGKLKAVVGETWRLQYSLVQVAYLHEMS